MKQARGQWSGYQSLNLYPVSWLLSQVSGIRVQDRMFSLRCRGGVQGAVHGLGVQGIVLNAAGGGGER